MRSRVGLTLVALLVPAFVFGQNPGKRPEWDQKKAVEIVQKVLSLEDKGDLPWDNIAWHTDPAKAAAFAEKEQKLLFVFFFLKKNVGPDTAPC